jgi:hypothetical protein
MFQFQELDSRRCQRGFDRVKLHLPTGASSAVLMENARPNPMMQGRQMKLKAKLESGSAYFNFSR